MAVALVTQLIANFTAYEMKYTAGRHHHGAEVSEQALTVQILSPMLSCP